METVHSRQFRPGDLDRTFGPNGNGLTKMRDPDGNPIYIQAIGIDASERILACGTSFRATRRDVRVFRLTPDGVLDKTFGDEGFCLLPNSDEPVYDYSLMPYDFSFADDGSMIIVGEIESFVDNRRYYVAGASRILRDGQLDTSFGDGGLAIYRPPHAPRKHTRRREPPAWPNANRSTRAGHGASAKQADGSVFSALSIWSPFDPRTSAYIIKIKADGQLDPSFGEDGFVEIQDVGSIYPHGIDVDGRGRVLISGFVSGVGTVARFLPDGEPDISFAEGGRFQIESHARSSRCVDVKVLFDEKLLVAVALFDSEPPEIRSGLIRLTADGQPDTEFNGGEIAFVEVPHRYVANSLLVDDGRRPLLAALGVFVEDATLLTLYGVTRFNANGTIDTDFGIAGTTLHEELHATLPETKLQNTLDQKRINPVFLAQVADDDEFPTVIGRLLG